MLLNIKKLDSGQTQEKSLDFSGSLDLSGIRWWGAVPYPAPVAVSGVLRRRAGIITVEYGVTGTREGVCARCLETVLRPLAHTFTHTVLEDGGEEQSGAYLLVHGGMLDVEQMVSDDLVPSLETVLLCREDCKGLCPKCGADRNEAACGCPEKEPDPRFDALRKLIDGNN